MLIFLGIGIFLALLLFFALFAGGIGAVAHAESKRVKEAPALFEDAGEAVVTTAGGAAREATIKAADAAGYQLESSVDGRYDSTMTFKRR